MVEYWQTQASETFEKTSVVDLAGGIFRGLSRITKIRDLSNIGAHEAIPKTNQTTNDEKRSNQIHHAKILHRARRPQK